MLKQLFYINFFIWFLQCDIYSLGIVCLELLNPFETDMERYKTIETLRSRSEIPVEIGIKWPNMVI
jgi:hypothetical protein